MTRSEGRGRAKALANTAKLADMKAEDFDTVFYPGGHGPMWDLAESPPRSPFWRPSTIRQANRIGVPFARRLRHVTYQGAPLVKGKHVAGFTNGEEGRCTHEVVPFLVEDELLRLGRYEKMAKCRPFPSRTAVLLLARILRHRLGGSGASETHEWIGLTRRYKVQMEKEL